MLPLRDEQGSKKFSFWVLVIIAFNVCVFYLELTSLNPDIFISQYALIPASVNLLDPPTLIPFVTGQFLHGGFLHIISNMWFLWVFGGTVESRLGGIFFPLLYLLGGTLGNILQYSLATTSTLPVLGASGAIAAVLGTYYALFPNNKIKTLVFIFIFVTIIDIPASIILLYWFVIQLFSSAAAISPLSGNIGGVAYFAHVGGFITGILVGKFFVPRLRHV